MLTKRDFILVTIIGAAVGLLVQPVLSNNIRDNALLAAHSGAVHVLAFFGLLIVAPLALFIASLIGRIIPVLYQFAKFAAVGTLNSFVDLGIFNGEILLLGYKPAGILYAGFKAVSFLCATTNSYFWNRAWTFQAATAASGGEAAKFYSIAIVGGFLNVGVATYVRSAIASPAFLSANLWTTVVAPLCGIFATLLWNFFGYKFLVFKSNRE